MDGWMDTVSLLHAIADMGERCLGRVRDVVPTPVGDHSFFSLRASFSAFRSSIFFSASVIFA